MEGQKDGRTKEDGKTEKRTKHTRQKTEQRLDEQILF